jgi:hypothetical protein
LAHCRPDRVCRRHRIGRRLDHRCPTAGPDAPHKPSRYHGRSCTSLVTHRDEAPSIFRPYVELLDCPLFGADRVRRVYEADKGRWRSPQPANLPSGDPAPPTLTLTLTLTNAPSIERPGGESESPDLKLSASLPLSVGRKPFHDNRHRRLSIHFTCPKHGQGIILEATGSGAHEKSCRKIQDRRILVARNFRPFLVRCRQSFQRDGHRVLRHRGQYLNRNRCHGSYTGT